MSEEYNSSLIVKLQNEENQTRIIEVLHEMEEIASPIFIYPVYEKWKKYKDTPISHYFISILTNISSSDVNKIAEEVISNYPDYRNICWIYPIFSKFKNYNETFITKAISVLSELVTKKNSLNSYELVYILNYLFETQQLNKVEELLWIFFLDDTYPLEVNAVALRFLLKEDPSERIKFIIKNFDSISTDRVDTILSKEFIKWKGPQSKILQGLLIAKGKGRSKEIFKKNTKLEIEKNKKESLEIEKKYSNTNIVSDIHDLRNDINQLCIAQFSLNFNIFENSENLIKQQQSATTEDSLKVKGSELRTTLEAISKKIGKDEFSIEEKKQIFSKKVPLDSYNKPLNRLYIFLKSKGISVDESLYGLRDLNRITSLFGHPKQFPDLLMLLKKFSIEKDWKQKDWAAVHSKILSLYKDGLIQIIKNIQNIKKT